MSGTEWLKAFPEGYKGAPPSQTVKRTMQKLADEFTQERTQRTDERVKLARDHVSMGRHRHDPERNEIGSAEVLTESGDPRIKQLMKDLKGATPAA